jgi:hypothetical protein
MRPTKPGNYFFRQKRGDPGTGIREPIPARFILCQVISHKIIADEKGNEKDVLVFRHEGEFIPVSLTSPSDWFYPDRDGGDWTDGNNIEVGDYVAGLGKVTYNEKLILNKLGSRIRNEP